MISKHMKRCPTPYVIRKCEIKQHELPAHILSIRVAKIQNTDNTKPARTCSNRDLILLMGMQYGTTTLEDSQGRILQPNIFLYDRAITFLEIYPKELKNMFTQKPVHDVYSSFIHNCPKWEATKMSQFERIYKGNISRQCNII